MLRRINQGFWKVAFDFEKSFLGAFSKSSEFLLGVDDSHMTRVVFAWSWDVVWSRMESPVSLEKPASLYWIRKTTLK